MLWDDTALYVGFEVLDAKVRGGWPAGAQDPHLWEKDTVEIMVDPDGDGDNKDYYEIQVNPQNLVFDTQYDGYNAPKTSQRPLRSRGLERQPRRARSCVHGHASTRPDTDRGYTVEAKIPWASFAKAQNPARGRRRVADELLRHEEQRRRGVVAHPGSGQLPPRHPLRPRALGAAPELTSAPLLSDVSIRG